MYEQNDFATGYAVGRDSTNNGNNGMFGGDWAWWIVILLLFGWGNNGFGNGFDNRGGLPCATQADVRSAVDQQTLISKLDQQTYGLADSTYALNNTLNQNFRGLDNAICSLGYNTQAGFNQVSHQISDCCCTTQRAIDSVKYENAQHTCDIIRAGQDNTRAILDFLTQDKISTLTAENQNLRFQASQTAQNAYFAANQEAQTAELIRRLNTPTPVPAYVVPNPNCCYGNSYNNAFGYGCGCNG